MKRLKELRQANNYTQQQLAEKLKTTQQTIARWENGKVEPSMGDLQGLAMIFSTSVDDLLGINPFSEAVATNHLCFSLVDEGGVADGFWGHLGLRLPNVEKVKWFPITLHVAEKISHLIVNVTEDDAWICVPTLNNKLLAFNPNRLHQVYLLDDASDGCDEWTDEAKVDYLGHPLEFYRGLDTWASEGLEDTAPDAYREAIEGFVKERGMEEEDVLRFLHETTIYTVNSAPKSYWADARNLNDIVAEVASLPKIIQISAEGGDFESYYPQTNLAAIVMPLIDLIDAAKEELEELEEEAA